MKNILFTVVFSFTLLASPASVKAVGLTSSQINAILSILSSFGADSATITNVQTALSGGTSATEGTASSGAPCLDLNNNLYVDVSDATTEGEVSKLQKFLGGRVTGYFGPATLQLVQNLQKANGIASSGSPDTTGFGYIGPKTRAVMACSGQKTSNDSPYIPPMNTPPSEDTIPYPLPPLPIPNPNPTASIDASSLTTISAGPTTITGSAANVSSVLVYMPANTYTGGLDYASVSAAAQGGSQTQTADIAHPSPSVVSNGRWSAYFGGSLSSGDGTLRVVVYDAASKALLAKDMLTVSASVVLEIAPDMSVMPTDCVVAADASACAVTVSWSNPNGKYLEVRNATTAATDLFKHFYTYEKSGASTVLLTRAGGSSQVIELRDGKTPTLFNSKTLSVSCETGTTWNGLTCGAPIAPSTIYIGNASGDVIKTQPGQTVTIVGSGGADTIYVNVGAVVDASNLGGGADRIYLLGNLASYAQYIDQETGVYTLVRSMDTQTEKVKFTVSDQDATIYFADGHIVINGSKDARLYNRTFFYPLQTSWLITEAQALSVTGGAQSQMASALSAFGSASSVVATSQSQANFSHSWNNNLQIGSFGGDVTALQTALIKEGVYSGEVTGSFYSQTFAAVKAFQQKYGIETTGFVGSDTRAKLNALFSR